MNTHPFLAAILGAAVTSSPAVAASNPLEEPLPLVGTAEHGHAYPGAIVPFGMVQLSPDTPLEGWDGCSGYHFSDSAIRGFSHTHLAGTGCGWCIPFLKQIHADAAGELETLTPEEYAKCRAEYIRAGKGKPPAGATPIDPV